LSLLLHRRAESQNTANTVGFYAIRGKSVKDFLVNSKAGSIDTFLKKIREENEAYKAIIVQRSIINIAIPLPRPICTSI